MTGPNECSPQRATESKLWLEGGFEVPLCLRRNFRKSAEKFHENSRAPFPRLYKIKSSGLPPFSLERKSRPVIWCLPTSRSPRGDLCGSQCGCRSLTTTQHAFIEPLH